VNVRVTTGCLNLCTLNAIQIIQIPYGILLFEKDFFNMKMVVRLKRRRQATIVNEEKSADVIAYVTVNMQVLD